MSVVPCPYCSNPVSLSDPWTGTAYKCPHCHRVVSVAPPPPAPPPPPPFSLVDDGDDEPNPRLRRRRPHRSDNLFWDLLTFRLMITPILVQILFWLSVLLHVVFGLLLIAGSVVVQRPSMETFALGVALMLFGILNTRVICELILLLFKIHDELKESNDRQRYRR